MRFAAALGWLVAVVSSAEAQSAQTVPGRDLLNFPIGTTAEAPGLAIFGAGGLYNPATLLALPPARLRVSVSHLNSPGDVALSGEVVSLAYGRGRDAFAVTLARAGVSGIDRTAEGDPQTILGAVGYDAFVTSLTAARRVAGHLAVGAALRHRAGRADTVQRSVVGGDVGMVADGLFGRVDGRVALSSFLWHRDAGRDDRSAVVAAADARILGRGPMLELRGGVSYTGAPRNEHERYAFVSGRWRRVEGRLGVAKARLLGGEVQTRMRFGLGVHYARLSAGVSREETTPGFAPINQFTLSSVLR